MTDLTKRFGHPPSHDDISRALHTVRSDLASYTPADESHWGGEAPKSIAEALQRMEALLYTLNSDTAIP